MYEEVPINNKYSRCPPAATCNGSSTADCIVGTRQKSREIVENSRHINYNYIHDQTGCSQPERGAR